MGKDRSRAFGFGAAGATRGFTLIEVMVSLVIVGGLLVTLLSTLRYHLDVAIRHETLTVAHMLGRQKLAEMSTDPKSMSGEFPEPYEGYEYESSLASGPYPGISILTVTVSRDGERMKVRTLVRGGG